MSTQPSDFEEARARVHGRDFAEVPLNLWNEIDRAPGWESEFNEENVFMQQYMESARQYYPHATNVGAQGRVILSLFMRWAELAAQFTRFVLRGDADEPLDAVLDWDAEGAGEAMVRPLRTDSFANAQYSQTPSTTGQFNIIPDDTQANSSVETATAKEQAWMIFGWVERLAGNEVPYDYLQANINDNHGVRREEFLLHQMEGRDTLKIAERLRGPLLVPPSFTLDVDVNVKTANIQTGLWPIGIEVIRADASEYGGVLG